MQLKRVSGFGLAVACLILVCACGSGSPGSPGTDDETVVKLTIPAAGGTIETDLGLSVVAPEGAVTTDTPITVSLKAPAGSGTVGLGAFPSAVECGPSGTTFASPIEIRIPVDKAPASADCALFSREGPGGAWTQLDQDGRYDAAGKYISLKTTHFSVIAYSDIPAPGLRVFADEFAKAGDWKTALAKLRELFVGSNGIMGLKQKVGDDTYEVCGVDIDVQYRFATAENQNVGDLTGTKTNDYTSLTYFHDDSRHNPDIAITSYTSVLIFWKKVVREQYLVTYSFTEAGGDYLTLGGYSSTMYFTVDVSADASAPVSIEDEEIVFDAYFNQTGLSSITTDESGLYFTDLVCPTTGDLLVLIGGATAPGSCSVALFANEPENFVSASAWGPDDEGGNQRIPVLDPELSIIGGGEDGSLIDGSLTVVLQDGYSAAGSAQMIGLLGIANLNYTVSVRKLR